MIYERQITDISKYIYTLNQKLDISLRDTEVNKSNQIRQVKTLSTSFHTEDKINT